MTSSADILQMPVHRLAHAVFEGSLTEHDVACACLERTRGQDPGVRAFLHVDEARVEGQALALDRKRRGGGRLGNLAGAPVAIKDSICTVDAPTTCASRRCRPPMKRSQYHHVDVAGPDELEHETRKQRSACSDAERRVRT